MSYSGAVAVIISIAQQASPIVSGHTLDACAQRATESTVVSRKSPPLQRHRHWKPPRFQT